MSSAKDRILDASSELFRRQGLTGTGIKQILDQAKAPFGSLYHHFPGGKDELAAETVKRAGAHYGQLVTEKLLAEPDLVSGVRAAFIAAGRDLAATGYADACPIETVALEVASTNERLRLATAEVFDSWLDGLTALLRSEGIDQPRRGRWPTPSSPPSKAPSCSPAPPAAPTPWTPVRTRWPGSSNRRSPPRGQ